jgi:methionine-rich copper-binding protein CopC
MNRFARGVALGALLVAGGVFAVAAPAQAHNYVLATIPASGSVLTQLPEQFSVTTNDNLLNLAGQGNGFVLQIRDAGGAYYGDGCVTVQGATMSATAALGKPGDYTIAWQLISTDGHTVADNISFTWQPDANQPAPSASSATPPDCHGTHSAATSAQTTQPSAPPTASAVPLGNVLWIGGAILVVGLAAGTTLLVATRRTKKD